MAQTTKMAPFTYDIIAAALMKSAVAAAAQCTGGANGRACGLRWTFNGKLSAWDGTTGVGQEMAAMEVILSTLIKNTRGPVTNTTGGTSIGNANAGSGSASSTAGLLDNTPATTGDKAGAGILTALLLVTAVGGMGWMSLG